MDSAKPIYKFLEKQNSQVVDLITQGRHLSNLKKTIKPYLNQHIKGHWQIGKFSNAEITILVESTELASRMRYKSKFLLEEIRKLEFCDALHNIEVKANPDIVGVRTQSKTSKSARLTRSRTGKEQLRLLADNMDDPYLKSSLLRLANRVCPEEEKF